jgi:hypothetical protein
MVAAALLLGGVALVAAHLTQRDDDGFYTSPTSRLATATYALTGEDIDLGDVRGGPADWSVEELDARTRIHVDPAGDAPLFVGIAPQSAVDAYLRGVDRDRVRDAGHHMGGDARYTRVPGARTPEPPGTQRIWAASSSGPGTQTVEWKPRGGRWAVVVMRADGGRDVAADVSVGVRLGVLLWIGLGLLAAGVLAAGGAAGLLIAGARTGGGGTVAGPLAPAVAAAGTQEDARSVAAVAASAYPVDVRAELDEPLSRWLWIVKWFLAIPHAIVLSFLWVAFVVLTIVAFFAILITGRYPRAIFDFNVGVLRWSWRVGYYGWAALGTDRYPPFTLGPADYPADLEIPYPERLSRMKVLFKWWLLAAPHLAILAAFFGWWNAAWTWGPTTVQPPGLLGVLVVVAGVVLLVTGRYPRDVFELVVGIARWAVRVAAYFALMRDEYPPFRLRA